MTETKTVKTFFINTEKGLENYIKTKNILSHKGISFKEKIAAENMVKLEFYGSMP